MVSSPTVTNVTAATCEGELTAERFGQPATEQCRRNIGVEDDDAHEPARREGYKSARNSAYSSSEANGSSSPRSSTEPKGRGPRRRISSSVATKSPEGRWSGGGGATAGA